MGAGKQVLLAEDEAPLARYIRFKLEREGFEVTVASDGGEALETSLSRDFDAVVLDVMMPVMDGFQVLKKIKEARPQLPVILISARGQDQDIEQGMELGASFYLVKPFKPAELLSCLHKCMG